MKEVKTPDGLTFKYYTPKELKAHLDEYVIGQEEAKKVISVAMYNHYKRVIETMNNKKLKLDKSNVLLAGPTGSGKTFMIKTLAEFMGIPYYIADATTLTQAGYVGDDVESILVGLLRAANYNIQVAQYGIVFIDEIDKIGKKNVDSHITKDPVGEGVQQALLKMVEGDKVGVPPQEGRKHPEQQLIYIDTKNILFIGSGAFSGIEDEIKSRMNQKKIGYNCGDSVKIDDFNPYDYLSQEDLRKFGLIPEFIGRFPIITTVNPLTKEDLVRVMKEPKNNIIAQYNTMLKMDDITINFTDDAYEYIADVALELKTGARAIRSILESILNEYVFEYADAESGTKISITKDDAKKKLSKRYLSYIEKVDE